VRSLPTGGSRSCEMPRGWGGELSRTRRFTEFQEFQIQEFQIQDPQPTFRFVKSGIWNLEFERKCSPRFMANVMTRAFSGCRPFQTASWAVRAV